MGHCISGVRLTVNHLSTQIMEGGRREIELYLSFGASGWQSVRRLVNEAVGAGVTPLLNSLNVIGLVSIPGERDAQVLIEHEYWYLFMTLRIISYDLLLSITYLFSTGIMMGQILGGSPVTEAAHYQILIMYLIATCTFVPFS